LVISGATADHPTRIISSIRRARRNAVINHNRRAAGDLRAFAIAQVAVALPIDFGEFGIASGFERSFVNTSQTYLKFWNQAI